MNDYNQTHSDAIAVMEALKEEHRVTADTALKPHQYAAIKSMEYFLTSRSPFLGINEGQQDYLAAILDLTERAL